jgi:transcriptional regulator with GAF, ATPase, and Fis domain
LPPSAQAKLLRVLQEGELERLGDDKLRKVNVRLVAATNVDLRKLVSDGRFRADLYYRLSAYPISIPPLRDRKEDVALLAKNFLAKYAATYGKRLRGFSDKAKGSLLAYPWPGNIRELQNTVERGVILAKSGSRVQVQHLFPFCEEEQPREFGLDMNGGLGINLNENTDNLCESVLNGVMTLDQIEAVLLQAAVDKARGNLSSAARMLGLTRPQLAYRLKRRHEAMTREGDLTADAEMFPT